MCGEGGSWERQTDRGVMLDSMMYDSISLYLFYDTFFLQAIFTLLVQAEGCRLQAGRLDVGYLYCGSLSKSVQISR